MTSTFERVVKSVVRELDPKGDLIPVDSLRSSISFRPYCLLGRKLSSSWFWKPRYKCLNLSIRDILEPDAPEPAVERVASFHIEDLVDGMVEGNVEVKALGQGKFVSGAAVSATASTSVNVCMLKVPLNTWGAMKKESWGHMVGRACQDLPAQFPGQALQAVGVDTNLYLQALKVFSDWHLVLDVPICVERAGIARAPAGPWRALVRKGRLPGGKGEPTKGLRVVKKVQSVLEQSSPWKEHRAVSLPQELLGSSWDSKAPAWVLLEECGLELRVDVPQVHWQPDAQGRTSALYACLVLLPHLSQDSA
ncbi:gasdermin-D [Puma concolor]|uniref:Gasdermin-D n=1 Tax=Puma concolor TaxID=9696 RepID=A0A6P6HU59_PUMCO|nr:gasdermin-D [Puma concolor]